MNIANNILKHYLKNVYFINGTAYAGKSTMCTLLAKKYGLIHCAENYCIKDFLTIATPEMQPNMCYFRSVKNWQTFLNRSPEEYDTWITNDSQELAGFEVAELIRISGNRKVIVDTNIPADILKRIADYNQVAIMLSPQSMSVDKFFDRDDPEKQFILSEIRKARDPEKAMQNFRACLARTNSQEHYNEWRKSGFFTIVRENADIDTRMETLEALVRHFGFNNRGK